MLTSGEMDLILNPELRVHELVPLLDRLIVSPRYDMYVDLPRTSENAGIDTADTSQSKQEHIGARHDVGG